MATSESFNQGSAAGSPGAILKRCREYHGITLEEAAAETRIGVSYLEALENDRIREFASLAYLKGFLRIYTAHLGLNNDDMVRLYEKLYAPEDGGGKERRREEDSGGIGRKHFNWQKLVLPALLLLAIIICSAIINRSPAPSGKESPPRVTPAAVTAAVPVQPRLSSPRPQTAPAKREMKNADPEKAPGEAQTAEQVKPKQPVEAARGFIVRMKVIGNGTLNVVIDGTNGQQYDLTAGDVIEWKADRSVALDLSNAGGVEVEQNGKPLKSLGPAGKPAYVVIEADGIKQQ